MRRGRCAAFPSRRGSPSRPNAIADALNTRLPPAVRVLKSVRAPDGFDACRAAKRKTYRYNVYISPREHPLLERYAVRVQGDFDLAALREAAALAEGEHDFAAFSSAGSSAQTTVRTLYSVRAEPRGNAGRSHPADGFLRERVPVQYGAHPCGRIARRGMRQTVFEAVRAALAGGGRELLGKTMPAKGLTLLSVEYGFGLFAEAGG